MSRGRRTHTGSLSAVCVFCQFDNEYFVNLLHRKWRLRDWEGPLQYEDEESGTLMMLPSDMALVEDDKMRKFVEAYANDQDLFFKDFAVAYAKLIALGCPDSCDPFKTAPAPNAATAKSDELAARFREYAMHGSVYAARQMLKQGGFDVHALEATSGRSALHKAAFWGTTQQHTPTRVARTVRPLRSAPSPATAPTLRTSWPIASSIGRDDGHARHACRSSLSPCSLPSLPVRSQRHDSIPAVRESPEPQRAGLLRGCRSS